VLLFTRALAVDLTPYGVRVRCVCPSVADTPMMADALGRGVGETLATVALGVHTPEQIAGQILFLASGEAATINGAALVAGFGGVARSSFPV